MVIAVACSVPPEPGAHARDRATASNATDPSGTSGSSLDPDSVCGRAARCCAAFAEVTPHVRVESACGEPAEIHRRRDADARCARMIEGWRTALERHEGVDPPDACSASGE